MNCPSCGYDNIEGMDRCANCMEPLRDLDVPRADATEGVVRSVMEDDLSSLSQHEVSVVNLGTSFVEAARVLREAETGAVLVLDGERFAGVFTERDAVRAMIAGDKASSVADVMTRDVTPLDAGASVAQALSRLSIGGMRFLIVAHADERHTIVSAADVLEYIAHEDW